MGNGIVQWSRRFLEMTHDSQYLKILTGTQGKLSPIVQPGFWESDVTDRTTDSALLSPPSVPRDHPFDEDDSNRCLSELLGTGQNGGQKCQISDACWEMMTSPSYTGYWLTHELFYLEVGERAGCLDQLEVRAAETGKRRGVIGMTSLYCANILREARKIAGDGFLESGQDLFIEQALLCGLIGYRDFFRSSWLSAILKWQSPSGCFGHFTTPSPERIAGRTGRHKRVRRRERKTRDGCLMHMTGVAAGSLAGYLRYILEYYQDLAEGRL
ncbi:C16orf89 [Branchiostoma lanceolatum]|uniref:C16orf89 protein n=1 Tax=Branchiostoma lanceolatum TaxID=7740 RepID=A0A8K0AE23_BRALA|nr:C16orf89 [Branchiostoma lanceolatum]